MTEFPSLSSARRSIRSGTTSEGMTSLPRMKSSCPNSSKNACGLLLMYSCRWYRSVCPALARVVAERRSNRILPRSILSIA
jgi:hypothetical protein